MSFVVIELGLEGLPPLLLCALRFAVTALFAAVLPRPAASWRAIAGIGLALGVGQFGLLFLGMDVGMNAGLASVVLQAQAPFTLLLAAVALRERPTAIQLAGLALAVAGITLIGVAAGGEVTGPGLALCVGGAASWAAANLLMKGTAAVDPVALMAWISLVPPLPLLALSLAIDGPSAVRDALAGISLGEVGVVLYISIVSTLGGFAAWSWLMRAYRAGQVASFALLVPPFGLAFGALALGEPLGATQVVAAALVVAGVAVQTRSSSARPSGPRTPGSVPPSGRSNSAPVSASRQRPAAAAGSSQP
jgi:O-acetylserine/cysteine efflux transporter